MDELIAERIERAIRERVFPGCVVGVIRKNGERKVLPFGRFTYEADAPAVKEDTIYDVASITKSIPTASLALQLIDEGKIKATDKLIDYLPEFNNSDRELVLIKHLLTYTLDGYGFSTMNSQSAEEFLTTLMTRDFERRPGSIFKYANTATTLLGLALEKIYDQTLDVLGDKHFFTPLGMSRTTFFPEKFPLDQIVPTEIDNWRGLVHGVVHDESAYVCKRDGKIVGHAGLFSTAPDILTFLEMLLNQGSLKGQAFFSPAIVTEMGANQIADLEDFTGLGWELNQPRFMGTKCGPHTFGKTGFTGTLCVCDVERGIGYVILSNRIYPKRPTDSALINPVRADLGEIILS